MAYVVEGGLFPADLLDKIAAGEGDGQRPADFARNGGSPSARMADAIQAAFSAARAHWDSYQYRLQTSQRAVARLTREDWVIKLAELLGYGELNRLPSPLEAAGLTYRMYATAGQSEYAPPVHIVGRDQPLDRRETQNRRSPHALVQEYLNNSDALWGIVTNGDRLRLLRDSARFTRPTYIEFDLKGIVESNQYAEFALLYRLLHRSRLPADGKPPNDCLLERYYQAGLDSHGRVRDKLRDGVERALLALGNGFLAHPDSDALRESVALRDGGGARLTAQDYYRQLLRLVYRLLFLMTAEERKMLLDPDNGDPALYAIYDAHYSVSGLRDRAERRFGDDRVSSDLWQGLKRTLALFREEDAARAIGLRALNGELFAESACPDLESAGISNYDLLRAMHNLSTFLDDDDGRGRRRRARRSAVRRRVHYAGIDVEEFGSVYESLLDFHPRIAPGITQAAPPEFGFAAGSERKQTGSYYTPPELVKELVNSALVPVMQERIDAARSADAKIAALLDISVCDPASGSGHFVLAAARRIATQLARLRSGDAEPPPAAYRAALREVIRRCIYAVDKNPLAVDLCKVALWIEGHEPGLPLSFLDHRIKCGDSLVGVDSLTALDEGIPNDAYKHIIGDDKAAAALWRKQNRQELKGNVPFSFADSAADSSLSDDFADLAAMADDSPRQVHEKEARYERIRAPQTDWWTNKTACDLWTAAFFMPKRPPDPRGIDTLPTTGVLRRHIANSAATSGELIGSAVDISAKNRFFHWRLEFPEVFHKGGFDVVLGNPPWERIKLQEKEFFASRDSAIAEAPNKAARARLISALPDNNPALAAEFAQARRAAESASLFARASGRYPLAARGDINTYSIFAETARRILNPTGRAGLIVPSGIATDDTTKVFFADAVNSNALVSLYDFENRQGIFPGVHRSYKFCLLTLSGERQRAPQAEFAFFLHDTAQLAEPARRFTLTAADFALFNPNTRTCPVFRTDRDMEIARKMYHRAGVFWREAKGGVEESNPWGVAFSRMFDVSNDSGLFRQREELTASGWLLDGNVFTRGDERYIPLYEAKMFQQYDHRYATFEGVSPPDIRKGNARSLTSEDKADVDALVLPRYWVHEKEVANRLDNVSQLADNITQPNPTQPNPTQPNPPSTPSLRALAELARLSLSEISSERPTTGRTSSQ